MSCDFETKLIDLNIHSCHGYNFVGLFICVNFIKSENSLTIVCIEHMLNAQHRVEIRVTCWNAPAFKLCAVGVPRSRLCTVLHPFVLNYNRYPAIINGYSDLGLYSKKKKTKDLNVCHNQLTRVVVI